MQAARRVFVTGGTGFVGRAVIQALRAEGYAVRCLVRRGSEQDLRGFGAIERVEGDVMARQTLDDGMSGCDAVVHLVGIIRERPASGSTFERVHVQGTQNVLDAAVAAGVRRYLHMSALRADAQAGPSHYLRSKGAAEAHLKALPPGPPLEWVILQPSVVFGPDDAFINKFAAILKITPGVLPLACAGSRFAPVWVGDVSEAFARCATRDDVVGRTFQLCGPEIVTLGDIVHSTARTLDLKRWVLPLPRFVSRLQAALMDFVPGKPFSTDNFRSATLDSICDCDGLAELGIQRSSMRGIVPRYLRR